MAKKSKETLAIEATQTGTRAVFGIVIDVNGTLVPISTDNIADYKKNGFKFDLPQPIKLGTFAELFNWLKENFDVDIPTTDLPGPIQKMVDAVTTLEFTVEQLKIDVPGSEAPEGTKTNYLIRISGAWADSIEIIPGVKVLKLKGGVFGVTNMANPDKADKAVTIAHV